MTEPELRAIFNEDADLYDRTRPGYPDALYDDLATWAPAQDALEIGCGTGQATRVLAARGYRITALDIGPAMAARARENLAEYPDVEVIIADFDTWTPPDRYDLVVSATAFHWLDPATRAERIAAVLKPGGALAVISTHHVKGGSTDFFHEVQRCYERWMPGTPPGLRLTPEDDITDDLPDLDDRFAPVATGRYAHTVTYPTRTYLDVLNTYSGHRALPRDLHTGLFGDIAALIDGGYGGQVSKRYLNILTVVRSMYE